jgi:hypothetical protein
VKLSVGAVAVSCALSVGFARASESATTSDTISTAPRGVARPLFLTAQREEIDNEREGCPDRPRTASAPDCGAVEVVDAAGVPIANAKVTWSDDKASEEMIRQHPTAVWGWSGVTNGHGRVFATELALGPGLLEVEAPIEVGGRCAGLSRSRWSGRPRRSSVRVVLKVRPVARSDVRGRVVDGSGRGIEGAKARLLSASWKSARGDDCTVSPEIDATSGADGAFVLLSVPHGTATFVIEHADHAEREMTVDVPGPLQDLTLDAGTTWKGRILRPDGSVLEGCQIGLTISHPPASREATCSATGFLFDHLPPVRAELSVSTRKDGDTQLGARVLKEEVNIQAIERWQQDLRWPTGETIAGRVVTSDGVPVPGATVFAVPVRSAGLRDGSGYGVGTRSDREGRFAFRHLLASGEWVLELRAGGHRETRVKVKTGSTDVVVTVAAERGGR